MATQSLYRRYRPRRFAELKGQDHVVRALRDAVRSGREGQAYLFSGPRGTGKTTSARILAKVLNCEAPEDGEPCCACDSCLAVERGTSYDVHELDAASNNGVDAIRDLIEKAALGTPGRHRVYILDEVHMLSRAAEAALLKTLEEPPPHVVFVLATTDPQKMSYTIRSRTQHLQFHLLPPDTLAEHVRWVANDAGLVLDPDQLDQVVESVVDAGGGSARDTLSALELLVATGGAVSDRLDPDTIVAAIAERDPGAVLTAVATAVRAGHDPRTLTETLVRHLRDCFLSTMAPDLVQLPAARVEHLAERARELGTPLVVRTIEQLGATLVDMRHAPDARILLEVALVRLTHSDAGGADLDALSARLDRLEQAVRSGAGGGGAPAAGGGAAGVRGPAGSGPGGAATAAPVDPGTGRAVVGGRARRARTDGAPAGTDSSSADTASPAAAGSPGTERAAASPAASSPPSAPATGPAPASVPSPASTPNDAAHVTPSSRSTPASDPAPDPGPTATGSAASVSTSSATTTDASSDGASSVPTGAPAASTGGFSEEQLRRAWDDQVRGGLKPLVRALYSAGSFGRSDGTTCFFDAPNQVHAGKCEAHRSTVEAALGAALGTPVQLVIAVGGTPDPDDAPMRPSGGNGGHGSTAIAPSASSASSAAGRSAAPTSPPEDHDIDLDDLVDAPPESVLTPIDRLAQAFPGSELVDDDL